MADGGRIAGARRRHNINQYEQSRTHHIKKHVQKVESMKLENFRLFDENNHVEIN